MRIDPVLALMDELECAYAGLAQARLGGDWNATRSELARIAALHADLCRTEPSTVIGAACLLREAAALMPRGHVPYHGDDLRVVAARFEDGIRRIEDLVWLRAVQNAMAQSRTNPGEAAAALIGLALKGAARPVLLYRNLAPPPREQTRSAMGTPSV